MEKVLDSVKEIAKSYSQIQKILLFGSRARREHKPTSDIDLAVFPRKNQKIPLSFLAKLDDIETLFKLDTTVILESTSAVLLDSINRDGVIIVENLSKAEHLEKAVARLKEAVETCNHTPDDLQIDGLIQRFEFCAELAWKSCKEKLKEIGFCEVNGPKPVMREAFSSGLIENQQVWLDILTDRNRTSHLYDNVVARGISENISTKYFPEFEKLVKKLLEE